MGESGESREHNVGLQQGGGQTQLAGARAAAPSEAKILAI